MAVGSAVSGAGSVSEEQFCASFENVPDVEMFDSKDFLSVCQDFCEILENVKNDWRKHVEALQGLRSLLKQGLIDHPNFIKDVYSIVGTALLHSVKDLRSKVCREAFITFAYFCQQMKIHFWEVAELLLPATINLVQNSAKVMASSAVNAGIYVCKYVHHPKIMALILTYYNSKSKEIRRYTIRLVSEIVGTWESAILNNQWPDILQSVKAGIHDADPEARALGRITYELLQARFPQQAEHLFKELDPEKKRMLAGKTSVVSTLRPINLKQAAFRNKRSEEDLNCKAKVFQAENQRSPSASCLRSSNNHDTITESTLPDRKQTNGTHDCDALMLKITLDLKNVDLQSRNDRCDRQTFESDASFINTGLFTSDRSNYAHAGANGKPNILSKNEKNVSNVLSLQQHSAALNNSGINLNNKGCDANQSFSGNSDKQELLIFEILEVLTMDLKHLTLENEKKIEIALESFSLMIRDNSITLWKEFFESLLSALLSLITQNMQNNNFKILTLRTLKHLCVNQPKRIMSKPKCAIINVLKAHNCDDVSVLRAVEECGVALINGLSVETSRNILLEIIDDETTIYYQLAGAIKMLGRVVNKMLPSDTKQWLPTFVPRMVKCFEHSQSIVRRASIICLVSIRNAVGMNALKPYISSSIANILQICKTIGMCAGQ